MTIPPIKIIGAGLAGCEAAWQLANKGVLVELYEMRPRKKQLLIKLKNSVNWFVRTLLDLATTKEMLWVSSSGSLDQLRA